MQTKSNRAVAAATAAAIVLAMAGFDAATSAPAAKKAPELASAGEMEFSARKRVKRRGNPGAAAFIGAVGAIASIAAAEAARRRYEERHYYPRHGYYGPHHGYYAPRYGVIDCGPGMNSNGHGVCVPIRPRYYRY